MSNLNVAPLAGAAFGAEIVGLDPAKITDHQVATIREVERTAHGLLCFSFGRLLSAEELHTLTAVFGESEFAPGLINGLGKGAEAGEENLSLEEQVARLRANGEDPYLSMFGNVDPATLERATTYPEFFGEWEWHTDMSYIEVPPTYSLLHARAVPDRRRRHGFL